MIQQLLPHRPRQSRRRFITLIDNAAPRRAVILRAIVRCTLAVMLPGSVLAAQVITIDTSGKGRVASNGPVDRQFAQIAPTHVDLPKTELDTKTRLDLIRALQSEHGFAMRPFPCGHRGLTLEANGKLDPAGENYLNMVVESGLSSKPGSQVVITNIKFEHSRIIFDLNDGPDAKHRFLRHIQIGMGPDMGDPSTDPTLNSTNQQGDPTGSRITLTFADHVPALTPAQAKALLAPLISFDVKTPIQAFTDTLPPALKDAILSHKVLVGMSTDMVLFAKGQPLTKSREMDGQMPFVVWIYGAPPDPVYFVRVNGNRVIKLEVADVGQPIQVYNKDVVSAMLRTDGTPVLTAESHTRTVREGDVQTDPDKEAPAAAPTLRSPGESLPADSQTVGVMRPVQFPKPHPDDLPGANPDEQQQPASSPATPQATQTGNGASSSTTAQQKPDDGSQPSAPGKPKASPGSNPDEQPAASSNLIAPTRPSVAQSN
jgi:hypothetical protein